MSELFVDVLMVVGIWVLMCWAFTLIGKESDADASDLHAQECRARAGRRAVGQLQAVAAGAAHENVEPAGPVAQPVPVRRMQ